MTIVENQDFNNVSENFTAGEISQTDVAFELLLISNEDAVMCRGMKSRCV